MRTVTAVVIHPAAVEVRPVEDTVAGLRAAVGDPEHVESLTLNHELVMVFVDVPGPGIGPGPVLLENPLAGVMADAFIPGFLASGNRIWGPALVVGSRTGEIEDTPPRVVEIVVTAASRMGLPVVRTEEP